MNKLFLAALIAVAGYFALEEYGGSSLSVSSGPGTGGAGFSQFRKAAGSVADSAVSAVRN